MTAPGALALPDPLEQLRRIRQDAEEKLRGWLRRRRRA